MYKHKHGSQNSEIPSDSLAGKHVFMPFVQVVFKGQSKTTAVWLFQETENISSDHLFRVRLKQPYATTTTSISDRCLEKNREFVVIDDTADDQKEFVEICSKIMEWIRPVPKMLV